MPIEIRELTIKVSVNPTEEVATSTAAPASGGSSAGLPDKEEIIAECIEQVMERLKDKTER
jgi:hypothetical protein